MAKKISVDQLSSEIMSALDEYKKVTDEVVKTAVNSVSKETKAMAQAGSRSSPAVIKRDGRSKRPRRKPGRSVSRSITVPSRG